MSGVRLGGDAAAVGGLPDDDELRPASTHLLTGRHLESCVSLDDDFCEWGQTGEVIYRPKQWPPELQLCLHDAAQLAVANIVGTNALPNLDNYYVVEEGVGGAADELAALGILSDVGFVEQRMVHLRHSDNIGWQLTDYGLMSLFAYEVLFSPRPALRARADCKEKDAEGSKPNNLCAHVFLSPHPPESRPATRATSRVSHPLCQAAGRKSRVCTSRPPGH
eukprot:9496661-Pyramimonas_sp.AAC.1